MKDHNHHDIQMSEAFLNSAFLALSGGFQDAYTYNARDEVFCNAQTGNVVLMSQHFMAGQWMAGLSYFFPIIFFALGVWVAEKIQGKFKYARKLHWRQGILAAEILILFIVGFIPTGIFCLCDAGTVLPKSKRIFLCKHYVHWKPSQWYSGFIRILP